MVNQDLGMAVLVMESLSRLVIFYRWHTKMDKLARVNMSIPCIVYLNKGTNYKIITDIVCIIKS
jgi:hypothetical protein